MATTESNIYTRCVKRLSELGARVLRNNVGTAWAGRSYRDKSGAVVIPQARHVRFGLAVGSGDGIGWHSIEITPEMVGRRVAVFVSLETKTATGRASQEQKDWFKAVHDAGGIAIIARSEGEAEEALEQWTHLNT